MSRPGYPGPSTGSLPPPPIENRPPPRIMDGMDQRALAIVYAAAFTAEVNNGARPQDAMTCARFATTEFRHLMQSKVEP